MPARRSTLVIALLLAASAGAAGQPGAPATPAQPAPAPAKTPPASTPPASTPPGKTPPAKTPAAEKPAAEEPKEIKTAEDLLSALETADKQIRTISAELSFTTVTGEIEGNDRQMRRGRIWFRNRSEGDPKAAKPEAAADAAACVRFEQLILLDSNKSVPENKTYVVNGPVMIEKIDSEKLVNRIRFAPDEKRQDPLKLGEGPFPVPFGQKKDEVLARFDAKLVPPLETVVVESLKSRLAETYQLVLTPKPNSGISAKVKEIRVWYQKKDLLPTRAKINRPDGGMEEFFLIAMQVNKALPPNVFDTSVPAGWKVQDKERP